MENLYSPATADQAQKTAKEAQKLGSDVKKDFDAAVGRGKDAAKTLADEMKENGWPVSGRAREVAESARRNLGKATERVSAYADDNTALVAVAAFGVGLLVGHLVSRES
jgi:predicted component of type VI protein secretion system